MIFKERQPSTNHSILYWIQQGRTKLPFDRGGHWGSERIKTPVRWWLNEQDTDLPVPKPGELPAGPAVSTHCSTQGPVSPVGRQKRGEHGNLSASCDEQYRYIGLTFYPSEQNSPTHHLMGSVKSKWTGSFMVKHVGSGVTHPLCHFRAMWSWATQPLSALVSPSVR